jgi:hypothetical protein
MTVHSGIELEPEPEPEPEPEIAPSASAAAALRHGHTSSFRQRGESIDEYEERLIDMAASLEKENSADVATNVGAMELLEALPAPPGAAPAALPSLPSSGGGGGGDEQQLFARLQWLQQLQREDGSPLPRKRSLSSAGHRNVPERLTAWRERAKQTVRAGQHRQSSPLDLTTAEDSDAGSASDEEVSAGSEDETFTDAADLERRWALLKRLCRDEPEPEPESMANATASTPRSKLVLGAAATAADVSATPISNDERQRTVLILMVMWMVREGGVALRLATEYVAYPVLPAQSVLRPHGVFHPHTRCLLLLRCYLLSCQLLSSLDHAMTILA